MADWNVDGAIADVESSMNKATATVLLSDEADERHLIGEAIVFVAILVLEKYLEGYFVGLGMEEHAVSMGQRTRGFFARVLGRGDGSERDEKEALVAAAGHLPAERNPAGDEAGRQAVRAMALDAGVPEAEADKLADASSAAFGSS